MKVHTRLMWVPSRFQSMHLSFFYLKENMSTLFASVSKYGGVATTPQLGNTCGNGILHW